MIRLMLVCARDEERVMVMNDPWHTGVEEHDRGLVRAVDDCVRRLPGARHDGGWHFPLDRDVLKGLGERVKGLVELDLSLLKIQLGLRKLGMPLQAVVSVPHQMSAVNLLALDRFVKTLALKAYSPATMHHYRQEFQKLLMLLGELDVSSLTTEQVKSYLLWLITKKGYGESHANTAVNAIKFYFEKVLLQPRVVYDLPRPKKPLVLPKVMGKESITRIIQSMDNLKHQSMLMLAYAAGLRVSEIVALKLVDIDSDRMCINIRRAKGKKDRVVALSPILLDHLRDYFRAYRPKEWLFEGQGGGQYSARSVQQVFKDAKALAGVKTPGGIHTMRHSFATHLLESGTDIRFIKDLLGHNSLSTTLRYTHVSLKQITLIKSPLDDLNLGRPKNP
ncbi:MAG: tyrosine-type recombinase/integrase [Sphingobacteriales bacterium]|jgi:integrase/recombinase XerD